MYAIQFCASKRPVLLVLRRKLTQNDAAIKHKRHITDDEHVQRGVLEIFPSGELVLTRSSMCMQGGKMAVNNYTTSRISFYLTNQE